MTTDITDYYELKQRILSNLDDNPESEYISKLTFDKFIGIAEEQYGLELKKITDPVKKSSILNDSRLIQKDIKIAQWLRYFLENLKDALSGENTNAITRDLKNLQSPEDDATIPTKIKIISSVLKAKKQSNTYVNEMVQTHLKTLLDKSYIEIKEQIGTGPESRETYSNIITLLEKEITDLKKLGKKYGQKEVKNQTMRSFKKYTLQTSPFLHTQYSELTTSFTEYEISPEEYKKRLDVILFNYETEERKIWYRILDNQKKLLRGKYIYFYPIVMDKFYKAVGEELIDKKLSPFIEDCALEIVPADMVNEKIETLLPFEDGSPETKYKTIEERSEYLYDKLMEYIEETIYNYHTLRDDIIRGEGIVRDRSFEGRFEQRRRKISSPIAKRLRKSVSGRLRRGTTRGLAKASRLFKGLTKTNSSVRPNVIAEGIKEKQSEGPINTISAKGTTDKRRVSIDQICNDGENSKAVMDICKYETDDPSFKTKQLKDILKNDYKTLRDIEEVLFGTNTSSEYLKNGGLIENYANYISLKKRVDTELAAINKIRRSEKEWYTVTFKPKNISLPSSEPPIVQSLTDSKEWVKNSFNKVAEHFLYNTRLQLIDVKTDLESIINRLYKNYISSLGIKGIPFKSKLKTERFRTETYKATSLQEAFSDLFKVYVLIYDHFKTEYFNNDDIITTQYLTAKFDEHGTHHQIYISGVLFSEYNMLKEAATTLGVYDETLLSTIDGKSPPRFIYEQIKMLRDKIEKKMVEIEGVSGINQNNSYKRAQKHLDKLRTNNLGTRRRGGGVNLKSNLNTKFENSSNIMSLDRAIHNVQVKITKYQNERTELIKSIKTSSLNNSEKRKFNGVNCQAGSDDLLDKAKKVKECNDQIKYLISDLIKAVDHNGNKGLSMNNVDVSMLSKVSEGVVENESSPPPPHAVSSQSLHNPSTESPSSVSVHPIIPATLSERLRIALTLRPRSSTPASSGGYSHFFRQ